MEKNAMSLKKHPKQLLREERERDAKLEAEEQKRKKQHKIKAYVEGIESLKAPKALDSVSISLLHGDAVPPVVGVVEDANGGQAGGNGEVDVAVAFPHDAQNVAEADDNQNADVGGD